MKITTVIYKVVLFQIITVANYYFFKFIKNDHETTAFVHS